MLHRILAVAFGLSLASAPMVSAQSLAQIGGPSEVPPASFKGDQFVDSRGCIFVRAGISGSTNWVPRVGGNHKVLCGYPPTFGKREAIPVAPDVAVAAAAPAPAARPAPAPVAAKPAAAPAAVAVADATPGCPPQAPYGRTETAADGRTILKCSSRRSAAAAPAAKPAPVVVASAPPPRAAPVAPAPAPVAAPVAVAATTTALPAQSVPARVVSSGGSGAGRVSCPASMPVLVRVRLTTGGTALLCTPGTQPIVAAAAPTYPPGSGLAPSINPQVRSAGSGGATAPRVPAGTTRVATADAMPPLPPGYKRAWKDDRLNPYRGQGTAEGWAQQDRIWTRTVPAEPVVTTKPGVPPATAGTVTVSTRSAKPKAEPAAPRLTVSTKSTPAAAAPAAARAGGAYIQVGTFGVPANASGAAGRLSAIGLPVATSKITKSGKTLQIVLAGPFASTAEAQRALSAARGAGFGDAFIR